MGVLKTDLTSFYKYFSYVKHKNVAMSGRKYEDLIKHKQAELENTRKKKKQLQIDKATRAADKVRESTSGNIETLEDLNKLCAPFALPPKMEAPLVEPTSESGEMNTASADKVTTTNSDVSRKPVKLSVFHADVTDIQPRRIFTNSKSTQTNVSRVLDRLIIGKYDDKDDEYMSPGGFDSKLPPGCMSPGLPKLQFVMPAVTPLEHINEEINELKELSEDEKQAIMSSKDFQNAMQRVGRIMQKVVSSNVDVTKDYVRSIGNGDENDEMSRGRVSLNRIFYDNQWSKNRSITGLDWSTYYQELMVASYHSNENEPLEPDGVAIVWNTIFQKQTPEYVFHCPSAVMSVCFAKFNPHLILAGTYSGQIVVWDNRSPKPIPVQSTTLNCGAHVQPIHSLRVIGTEGSHNIISISSDGKLCSWNLDMLSEPVDILTLEKEQKRQVAVTCMAFAENESNDLVIGSEDGCVYSACRSGLSAGVNDKFEKHEGPITGISGHYYPSSPEFNHLFLTSSIDSTIKLWSLSETKPLYTFKDNCDYVMDVAWSPIHPALFAAVDGSGRLDLWNLNMDTEEPTVSLVIDGQPALNRISWMPNGQHIAVGDIDGKLYLYDIADHLAQPLPGESSVFGDTLKVLKHKMLYT